MLTNWESLILGALAILLLFWFRPGVKAAFTLSKQSPADWPGVLIPLALVVAFVLVLIALV
ncbi:MAG: hypothetical protein ABSB19_19390 [Methylomonas sp.]|jgi:hypothetical protein